MLIGLKNLVLQINKVPLAPKVAFFVGLSGIVENMFLLLKTHVN